MSTFFQPFDPGKEVHNHRLKLPHWRQWGTTYFVTSRLADSVPAHVRDEWRARRDAWLAARHLASLRELEAQPEDVRHDYHREFTARFHELLDAGHGECLLANEAHAEGLKQWLLQGHESAYQLDAWVIMPNHLHALVAPQKGTTLGSIIQKWKGGSARQINRATGRTGKLWQHEPFDHIVRSEAQLQHFRRYIAMNPQKAGLQAGFVLGVGNESGLPPEELLGRFEK